MRSSAVLSLSHTSVNDGQRMYSMDRLERWERIYLHFWHRNRGDQLVEAEYSLNWGQLFTELSGGAETTDPPLHDTLHYPFPCKAVREHGEKTAMFCACVSCQRLPWWLLPVCPVSKPQPLHKMRFSFLT